MDITTLFLIILIGLAAFFIGKLIGQRKSQKEIEGQRQDAINKSRAVLGGQFAENLAPYLPNFPFSPTECKFIGKPIDFIVFEGMDNKEIKKITFVEVKSGKSKLSSQERNLKETIKNKNIDFVEYRVDEEITKG